MNEYKPDESHRPSVDLDKLERAVRLPPVFTIEQVLTARNSVHGKFEDDARTSQALKHVMHEAKNWYDLTNMQKEALEQIATKIGRILSGDPNHVDAWFDIAGYAKLVVDRL